MSKMGQELENRLDANKYKLLEVLKEIKRVLSMDDVEVRGKGLAEQDAVSKAFFEADKVIKDIEG